MKKITDKQRMDFLERQGFTRWVGYTTHDGIRSRYMNGPWKYSDSHTTWPVFNGDSFRAAVDRAIEKGAAAQKRSSQQHSEGRSDG